MNGMDGGSRVSDGAAEMALTEYRHRLFTNPETLGYEMGGWLPTFTSPSVVVQRLVGWAVTVEMLAKELESDTLDPEWRSPLALGLEDVWLQLRGFIRAAVTGQIYSWPKHFKQRQGDLQVIMAALEVGERVMRREASQYWRPDREQMDTATIITRFEQVVNDEG